MAIAGNGWYERAIPSASLALKARIPAIYGSRPYAGDPSLAPHGTGVTITVEDDGPGSPAGQLDEVLRPFTRLDSSRARNTTGMGLGLAIVDTLVKAEHGTLVLANRPTGGLRVTLDLPGEFGAEGQSEGQAG